MTENKSKIHKVNSSELWNYLVKNMQIDFSNQNSSIEHLYSYTFVSEKKYKVHALRVFLVKTNNFFVHNANKKIHFYTGKLGTIKIRKI